MSTTTTYTPRDFRRVCDECGVRYNRSELHRKGPWILCDTCDMPGDRIREEEDAAIARQEPFRILPVPNSKPLTPDSPYTWQAEEAQVFNLVKAVAPAATYGGASDFDSAAYAAIYMADVLTAIEDGDRPAEWGTAASTTLTTCLTYLNGLFGSYATTSIRYGSINATGSAAYSAQSVIAGLAFLKGYAVTGTTAYLGSAKLCAQFLCNMQAVYSVSGGISESLDVSTSTPSLNYRLADIMALWFFVLLADEVGESATYGVASPSDWATSTSQTLGTMITNLTAFAVTGPRDTSTGNNIPGLSVTAPRATFVYNGTTSGTWTTIDSIPSVDIAKALRGLYEADPDSTTLAAMLAWLAAFTANADNATLSTNTEQQTLNVATGDYDPAICPATFLTAAAPFTESFGAIYDLQALGLLAPALAASDADGLRDSRSTLSAGQRFSTVDLSVRYLGTTGRAGLELQPISASRSIPMDPGDDTSDGQGHLHFDQGDFTASDGGSIMTLADCPSASDDGYYRIIAVTPPGDVTVTPGPSAAALNASATARVTSQAVIPDVGRAACFGAVYRYVNP